jgi:hypothetical protein
LNEAYRVPVTDDPDALEEALANAGAPESA